MNGLRIPSLVIILLSTRTLCLAQTTLQSLRAEMGKATAQTEVKYLQKLYQLKLEYTRAGKLEEAVAVDNEIKSEERRSVLKSKLENTKWTSVSKAAVWTFQAGGVYQLDYEGKTIKGSWRVIADQLVYVSEGKGIVYYFSFSEDFATTVRHSPRDEDSRTKGTRIISAK